MNIYLFAKPVWIEPRVLWLFWTWALTHNGEVWMMPPAFKPVWKPPMSESQQIHLEICLSHHLYVFIDNVGLRWREARQRLQRFQQARRKAASKSKREEESHIVQQTEAVNQRLFPCNSRMGLKSSATNREATHVNTTPRQTQYEMLLVYLHAKPVSYSRGEY